MSRSRTTVPRAIRLLTEHGMEALKSSVVNGRYRAPLISRQTAAKVRRRSLVEGTYGQFTANRGGWDPSWDAERKFYMLNPLKGHAQERNREERAKKIDLAMRDMGDKIKKLELESAERRPKKDLFYKFKKALDFAKKNR